MQIEPDENLANLAPLSRRWVFLPAWWIDVWNFSTYAHDSGSVLPPQFSPNAVVDQQTLALHPYLFAELQRQLITRSLSSTEELDLEFESLKLQSHIKVNAGDAFQLEMAAKSFCRLNIARAVNGQLVVENLFRKETWSYKERRAHTLSLLLDSKSRELLCGFSDGHLDLYRSVKGESPVCEFMGECRPVLLDLNLWTDLTVAERPLVLRWLQVSANQATNPDDRNILSGISLDDLFEGSFDGLTTGVKRLSILEQLNLLARLGRKLVKHQFLDDTKSPDLRRNFAEPQAVDPSVVWKVTANSLQPDWARNSIGTIFLSDLKRPAYISELGDFWALVGRCIPARGQSPQVTWSIINDCPGGVVRVGSSQIVQLQNLFMEWCYRLNSEGEAKLPSSLYSFPALNHCSFEGDVKANFERFRAVALNSTEFITLLVGNPPCSWAQGGSAHIVDILGTFKAVYTATRSSSFSDQRPKISSVVARTEQVPPQIEVDLPRSEVHAENQHALKTDFATSSKLLRIAQDELEKMLRVDRTAYEALAETYLKSLEEDQRQLVFDVKRRMRPLMFEQQLKPRLVRFMVAHPGQWKSSYAPLQ